MKLNEQISFLRRERGITQEQLANVLGVSNQSVSKWESGQCCPDIALLPQIAEYFGTSVDELLGCKRDRDLSEKSIAYMLREAILSLSDADASMLTLHLAYSLHAAILSKLYPPDDANSHWDEPAAFERAMNGDWGLSAVNMPDITTYMNRGTVVYSDNNIDITDSLPYIKRRMQQLCEGNSLRVLSALYTLTIHDDDATVTADEIAETAGLTTDEVKKSLTGSLRKLVHEKEDFDNDAAARYRINGSHLHIIPVISLLGNTAKLMYIGE